MPYHRRGNPHRSRTVTKKERKTKAELADLRVQKDKLLKEVTCELKSEICSGQGVTRYQGTKKSDPKFFACLACKAWYSMRGVKMKQIPT